MYVRWHVCTCMCVIVGCAGVCVPAYMHTVRVCACVCVCVRVAMCELRDHPVFIHLCFLYSKLNLSPCKIGQIDE